MQKAKEKIKALVEKYGKIRKTTNESNVVFLCAIIARLLRDF